MQLGLIEQYGGIFRKLIDTCSKFQRLVDSGCSNSPAYIIFLNLHSKHYVKIVKNLKNIWIFAVLQNCLCRRQSFLFCRYQFFDSCLLRYLQNENYHRWRRCCISIQLFMLLSKTLKFQFHFKISIIFLYRKKIMKLS